MPVNSVVCAGNPNAWFNSEARIHKIRLANWLRKEGLTLNEAKTKIFKVADLHNEETELERLFQNAREEVVAGTVNIG